MPPDSGIHDLFTLFVVFAPLSLSALGGGISIIAEIQHQAVDVRQWVTGPEFLNLFAIARGSPGPGTLMLATLLGLKVAGLPGAITATLAMFLPSSMVCIGAAALWRRYRATSFLSLLEKSLVPVGAGLLIAGVASLGGLVSGSWILVGVALGASAICLLRPGAHPLILIGLGAAVNLLVVTFL